MSNMLYTKIAIKVNYLLVIVIEANYATDLLPFAPVILRRLDFMLYTSVY